MLDLTLELPWVLHLLRSVLLVTTSICLLPISAIIMVLALCTNLICAPRHSIPLNGTPPTILVTGIGMTKGLFLVRTMYIGGCRVIGADFDLTKNFQCGRFSNALSRFVALKKPSKESADGYINQVLGLILDEHVDLWIPCSGVATAIEDAQLAKAIKKHTECRVFQCEEDVVEALDDKLKFMQKTSELGLASLKWLALCDEVDIRDIVDKIRCGNQDLRYMIKSASMDDATRGLLPLLSARDPDKVERILGNLKFSNRQQWLLQEYLPSGEEYCTHALIINGTVRAFTACPSASVLMHYKQLPISSMLYKQMLKFTQEYAAGLGKITGHMSFDFLIRYQDTVDGHIATLAPIECNPRCHTATVLFEGMESELAQVYLEVVHGNKTGGAILHPQSSSEVGYYWMAHDLVVAVSAFFDHFNSDRLSRAVSVKRVLDSIYHGLAWRDPTFQWWDPLPWFVLNHLYWPWVLVKAALNGVRWKQLNVSTTKMFEM